MSLIKKFRPKTFLRKLGIKNAELEAVHDIVSSTEYSGRMIEVEYMPLKEAERE